MTTSQQETIERLVLEILTKGEHEYEELVGELHRIYEPTEETCQMRDLEKAIWSLMARNLICQRYGDLNFDRDCEGDCFYKLTKKAKTSRYAANQKEMSWSEG